VRFRFCGDYTDMCKFESSQQEGSGALWADSWKAYSKGRTLRFNAHDWRQLLIALPHFCHLWKPIMKI